MSLAMESVLTVEFDLDGQAFVGLSSSPRPDDPILHVLVVERQGPGSSDKTTRFRHVTHGLDWSALKKADVAQPS